MKIVFITTVPMTQWAFLCGQNAYMRRRGFELHAISSPGPELDRLACRDHVVIHPVSMSREITPAKDLVALVRLFVTLRRIRPSIVHLSTPKAALLGAMASWAARVPVRIFLVRGLLTEGARGLKRLFYRRLEWLTARFCHRSICVSPSLLDFARAEGILGPEQGVVLAHGMSNGIDPQRFDPAVIATVDLATLRPESTAQIGYAGSTVIGFVGRLARDKGIEEIFNAWKMVRDEFPAALLLLVGPWEKENPVPEPVRRGLESDPRVILAGMVQTVENYYKIISIFIYPSHGSEGFPNAPMEAAAMGLPVVASRVVGSVDAVVDGVTGVLIPPHDPRALADAIRKYFKDPELRRKHGRAGRERVVRDFRGETIWEAMYREYVRSLQGRYHPKQPWRSGVAS
jgi:glycosyltransferase involved in cell wall biosynthesis